MSSQFLNTKLVDSFVQSAGNRIFTINFERLDGTRRTINARRHVTKGVKMSGSPKKVNPDVLVIFDMKADAFRSVRKDRVLSIELAGAVLAPKTKFRKPKKAPVKTVDLLA